jgi:hypothetical protein
MKTEVYYGCLTSVIRPGKTKKKLLSQMHGVVPEFFRKDIFWFSWGE